jgi:peptidyl-prolyl cis-trans isomerase SurA
MEDKVWTKASQDSIGLKSFFENNREEFMWGERVSAVIYSGASQEIINEIQNDQLYEAEIILGEFIVQDLPEFSQRFIDLPTYKTDPTANYSIHGPDSALCLEISKFLTDQGINKENMAFSLDKELHGRTTVAIKSHSKKMLEWLYNRESALTLEVFEGLFEKGDHSVLDEVAWEPGKYQHSMDGRYYFVVIDEVLPPQNKELMETKGTVISRYQDFIENQWVNELKNKYTVAIDQRVLHKLY